VIIKPPSLPSDAAQGRKTLADELRRQIADEILEGHLPPGLRLDEQDLAARFGVSRTPVREALKLLIATGLVQERARKGVLVATLTQERLAEMFEVMGELEASCARFAAQRMSQAEKRALADLHQDAAQLMPTGDDGAYDLFNDAFHAAIYSGAHNVFLEETALTIRQRVRPFRRAQFRVTGRLEQSWAEHDSVVRAIVRSDGEAAYHSMRAHVSAVGTASADYLSLKRGTPSAPTTKS
jgi:DNA-binding GntR family transcriptional regulator